MTKNGASSNTSTRRSGNFSTPPSSRQDPLEYMHPHHEDEDDYELGEDDSGVIRFLEMRYDINPLHLDCPWLFLYLGFALFSVHQK
jgi:hypothetical protein